MIRKEDLSKDVKQIADYMLEHGYVFDSLYDVSEAWFDYSYSFSASWLIVGKDTLEEFLVYLDRTVIG